MSRILFVGDAADSGFGTVTRELGLGLLRLGQDVRFMSMNATGRPLEDPFRDRTMFVSPYDRPEALLGLLTRNKVVTADGSPDPWKPDAIVICADFRSLDWVPVVSELSEAFKSLPVFHYCPIEGRDLPPDWNYLWKIVRPVAMSEFGAAEMEKITGYRPPMIYHGVDQETFKPQNKTAAKRAFGLNPDRLLLLRADRHMPRKLQNSLLRACLPVMEQRPKVDLVLHCRPEDEGGYLPYTLSKFPAWFMDRLVVTGAHDTWTGLPREKLAQLYNAADIYVSTSAEGFGLTIAEALACGVPAVGIDYSAVPEIIGPAGITVPIAYEFDNPYDHFWAAPDERAFGQALLRLIDSRGLRRTLGNAGPPHVAEHFSWSKAAEQFATLIGEATSAEKAA